MKMYALYLNKMDSNRLSQLMDRNKKFAYCQEVTHLTESSIL